MTMTMQGLCCIIRNLSSLVLGPWEEILRPQHFLGDGIIFGSRALTSRERVQATDNSLTWSIMPMQLNPSQNSARRLKWVSWLATHHCAGREMHSDSMGRGQGPSQALPYVCLHLADIDVSFIAKT